MLLAHSAYGHQAKENMRIRNLGMPQSSVQPWLELNNWDLYLALTLTLRWPMALWGWPKLWTKSWPAPSEVAYHWMRIQTNQKQLANECLPTKQLILRTISIQKNRGWITHIWMHRSDTESKVCTLCHTHRCSGLRPPHLLLFSSVVGREPFICCFFHLLLFSSVVGR